MFSLSLLAASIFEIGAGYILAWLGIGLTVGILAGAFLMKIVLDLKLTKAKSTASKIIEDALNEAKSTKKEAILEAKEEAHKLKVEVDQEIRERKLELQKLEEKIYDKEEFLNKKEAQLDTKSEYLDESKKSLEEKENNFASKLSVVFFLFEAHGWTVTKMIQ